MKKTGKLKTALMCFCAILGTTVTQAGVASAACAELSTEYGTVTGSFRIETAGTYRVWSRIMSPDMNADSFILEVDGTQCNIVVGDAMNMSVNSWVWIDFKSGSQTDKIDLELAAGDHTYKIYGREEGVKLDRIVFALAESCPTGPVGNGDNCLPTPEPTPSNEPTPTPTTGGTPTPTPGSTPTPTPGTTPTPTPGGTPTPTPGTTPTPTPGTTPSPTPGSTPTPTPGGTPTPTPIFKDADLNLDGQVDGGDLSLLFTKYNQSSTAYDLTSDGRVTIEDLAVLLGNYGK